MEFSEASELKRIASRSKLNGESSPFTKLVTKYNPNKKSDFSPSIQPGSNSSFDFPTFPTSSTMTAYIPNDPIQALLKIEKDTSYLNEPNHHKRSSLTMSLLSHEPIFEVSQVKQLILEIYFFCTPVKIQLIVPQEITVIDMMAKALSAYSKTESRILPHGLNTDGYEVWIPEDDGYMPDTDYAIDRSLYVAKLAVNVLCICEKPGFKSDFSNGKAEDLLRRHGRHDGKLVKFYFENTSALVAVNPNLQLREVLVLLWKKFFILGDLNADMFEFRVFIEEGGYECALDMGLMIKELPKMDIRLYRKVHADTPKNNSHMKNMSQNFKFDC